MVINYMNQSNIHELSQCCSIIEVASQIEQVLIEPERIKTIKSISKSINFDDMVSIGKYGSIEDENDKGFMRSSEKVINGQPMTSIAKLIENLISSLVSADPRLLQKKQPWYKSFTGKDITERVEYCTSFYNINNLLQLVPEKQKDVEEHLLILSGVKNRYLKDTTSLRNYLIAGAWYLQAFPVEGTEKNALPGIESSRDRFTRRLTNLQAMIGSTDLAIRQIALIEANTLSLLDRLHEITSVLIPSWRNRSSALQIEESIDVNSISQATIAHDQLLTSLSELRK
jgi:hypothetical protein